MIACKECTAVLRLYGKVLRLHRKGRHDLKTKGGKNALVVLFDLTPSSRQCCKFSSREHVTSARQSRRALIHGERGRNRIVSNPIASAPGTRSSHALLLLLTSTKDVVFELAELLPSHTHTQPTAAPHQLQRRGRAHRARVRMDMCCMCLRIPHPVFSSP